MVGKDKAGKDGMSTKTCESDKGGHGLGCSTAARGSGRASAAPKASFAPPRCNVQCMTQHDNASRAVTKQPHALPVPKRDMWHRGRYGHAWPRWLGLGAPRQSLSAQMSVIRAHSASHIISLFPAPGPAHTVSRALTRPRCSQSARQRRRRPARGSPCRRTCSRRRA